MREPLADLSDEHLLACVIHAWGVIAFEIEFLPRGHDPAAWVYRIDAEDGRRYFLKVCLRIRNGAGLLVPHYLSERGLANVVAPLPCRDGSLMVRSEGFSLILYPFIDGQSGMQQRLTPHQWRTYGAILRQLHAQPITPKLASFVERDTLTPPGAEVVRQLDAHLRTPPADDAQRRLAVFWQTHRDLIRRLLARAELLGHQLALTRPTFVLCHADIHTNNVMVDTDGQLWLVDWDEVVLAPPERDLMFAVGGINGDFVTPTETELFLQGYGPAPLDPLALAYYRYAWAVSDIGAFGESICFRPDLSLTTRLEEAVLFETLFAPGQIVEIAQASPLDG